jgi:tetratricopeptide (TPR) repeat protein
MTKKQTFEKTNPKGDVTVQKRDRTLQRILELKPFLLLLFASILTFIVYIRSINGPLVLDDIAYINSQKLQDVLQHFSTWFRRVTILSFVLNFKLSGISPFIFRITNIVLHIVTGVLTFSFTYTTLNMPSMKERFGKFSLMISISVAVLFVLHPIQTATVNYIIQRSALMAALFSFLGLFLYAKASLQTKRTSLVYYALSCLSFFLALLSKETSIMMLLIIPLYDFIFISSFNWKAFRKRLVPLLLIVLSVSIIAIWKLSALNAINQIISVYTNMNAPIDRYSWMGTDMNWTPIEYFLTELRVVSRYIFLIFFPNPSYMVFDYSNAYPVSKGLFSPISTFVSFLFLASLLFLSLRYIKRYPLISFGILWYLILISFESFVFVGLDPYFEHRNYLPVFGILLVLSSTIVCTDKLNVKGKVVLFILAVILLSLLTFIRNGAWTDEVTLWKDVAEKVPDNRRALVSLSSAYIKHGKFSEAEQSLLKAFEINPQTAKSKFQVLINMASIYRDTNRRQDARKILNILLSQEAISKADKSQIYFFLGEMDREEGKLDDAKNYLEKAMAYRTEQDNPRLLTSLGLVNFMLGNVNEAESMFLRSLELDQNDGLCYLMLASIKMQRNYVVAAIENYEKARSLKETFVKGDPNAVFLYYNLGMAYLKKRDMKKAKKNLELFITEAGSDEEFQDAVEKAKNVLARLR